MEVANCNFWEYNKINILLCDLKDFVNKYLMRFNFITDVQLFCNTQLGKFCERLNIVFDKFAKFGYLLLEPLSLIKPPFCIL